MGMKEKKPTAFVIPLAETPLCHEEDLILKCCNLRVISSCPVGNRLYFVCFGGAFFLTAEVLKTL